MFYPKLLKIMENPIAITKDLIYKHDLKLDLYSGQNTKGAIIDIHGGGWFQDSAMIPSANINQGG